MSGQRCDPCAVKTVSRCRFCGRMTETLKNKNGKPYCRRCGACKCVNCRNMAEGRS